MTFALQLLRGCYYAIQRNCQKGGNYLESSCQIYHCAMCHAIPTDEWPQMSGQ